MTFDSFRVSLVCLVSRDNFLSAWTRVTGCGKLLSASLAPSLYIALLLLFRRIRTMATQRLKSLCDDNDLFESPDSNHVLGQVAAGTIIEVEREPIYVADVKMFLVRPRGAVQYDSEWFSILPDEEELVLPCGGLDDGFHMPTVDGVGQLSANSKESHARARSVVATGDLGVRT